MIQKLIEIAEMAHSTKNKLHLSMISTPNKKLKPGEKKEKKKKTHMWQRPDTNKGSHHQMRKKAMIKEARTQDTDKT